MVQEFNNICTFRQQHPGDRGSGVKTNDPILSPIYKDLEHIRGYLSERFSTYRNKPLEIEISKGQSYFPGVLHVVILPPHQKVSNGIYVAICFDIKGRGALVGCAESITNPKGLNTTIRKRRSTKLNIDVDGLRPTTKYNNIFGNPKEFFAGLKDDQEVLAHIQISLDLAFYNLGLIDAQSLRINDITVADKNEPPFDPKNLTDAKKLVARQIAARRGQKKFRNALLKAYDGKCAITDCNVESILEAAHIIPYNGQDTNHVQNGILMRSDIHLLFDLGLLTIKPKTYKIILHPSLAKSNYWVFNGKQMNLPYAKDCYPHNNALEYHEKNEFKN